MAPNQKQLFDKGRFYEQKLILEKPVYEVYISPMYLLTYLEICNLRKITKVREIFDKLF